ncbi:hypothetical protein TWF694_002046 [Orbilia ellipsospora]|uniref:Peptidase A1 domain-containing protein n=1 Tax=Orbilia ellipsospora TaxID=2528407 RepID=A0AAV9X4E9_9PEZI
MFESEAGGPRFATLGGLILAKAGQQTSMYGMTVGHAIPILDDVDNSDNEGTDGDDENDSDSFDENDEDGEDGEDGEGNEENNEMESSCETDGLVLVETMNRNLLQNYMPPSYDTETLMSTNGPWLKIGSAFRSPLRVGDNHNLDWGIIQGFESQEIFNISAAPGANVWLRGQKLLPDTILEPKPKKIVVLSGYGGPKEGLITFGLSFVALGPEFHLTRAYSVNLIGSEIQAGDCGSWAVDVETDELYGHVVASNAFGEAYVIPIQSSLSQIKYSLEADEISLPVASALAVNASKEDVEIFLGKAYQDTTSSDDRSSTSFFKWSTDDDFLTEASEDTFESQPIRLPVVLRGRVETGFSSKKERRSQSARRAQASATYRSPSSRYFTEKIWECHLCCNAYAVDRYPACPLDNHRPCRECQRGDNIIDQDV